MADSYSVKAILSAKDSGFSSTLKSAANSVSNIDKKISGLSFGVLSGVGTAAFNTIKSSVSGLITEMNSSNVAWKTFEGNMKIIGKEKKEINSVKSTLQDYATKTIYSSSDMATSYAQLAAVGIKSADKLVTGFGGLAGAAEDPAQAMKTLSQQGVQMAAKPSVAWQDFKLMLEQTPAGMAAVAKKMGMTTSELVTAVQDGEISTKSFFKAVQQVGNSKSFTKLATEYKSVDQAMDGLQETVGNKLNPAFDVLQQKGIKAISGIIDKLGDIDGQKVADKVSKIIDKVEAFGTKCKPYIDAFVESFSGVRTEVLGAFTAVKDSLGELNGEFGSTESVDGFKGVMTSVADAVKGVASFVTEHSDSIAKFISYLPKIAAGLAAFKVAKTVAPGISLFASGVAKIGSKIGGGIASKLFGTSKAQDAVGKSSSTSGAKMLKAAQSYALMGVALLLIAVGFALLAQSAIALSNAGGLAIGVMAGLVIALVGLGVGMAVLLKTLAPMSKQLMPVATAMLAMGAAVLLVSIGFAILAASSIALANAGGAAIGVMVGMVAAIALLAVGAALLGTSLTAGAVGFLAFGAAVLMVGAGFALIGVAALLAANALTIISTVLPVIAASGLQGALAIAALGAGLLVFAVGAGVAGAACILLGAGLLMIGTAVLLAGTGMLLLGTGAMLAAGALQLITAILPQITEYGISGAAAIAVLGAGLLAFGAGALVAGAGAVVLGAGLAVVAVGIALVGVGIAVLAAGVLLLVASVLAASIAILAASGALAVLNLALPLTIQHGAAAAAAMLALGAGFLVLGAGALVAGAGVLVLGAGMLVASAGVTVFGGAMIVASAGSLILAGSLKLVNSSMKSIAKNAKTTQKSLKSMNSSVDAVSSGLDAIGDKAKSALNKLTSAFDNSAKKSQSSGKKVGTGFTKGLQSGLNTAPAVASKAVVSVSTSLMTGRARAYSAGAFISIGFAQGMLSQLAFIKAAAAQMAAAADAALRAKAKIHSPSDLTDDAGGYFGEGWVNGILGSVKAAKKAVNELVYIPQVKTPQLAYAYAGELSEDYSYSANGEYIIEVPLEVDGKEFARATAKYSQDELNRRQTRENRKKGKV